MDLTPLLHHTVVLEVAAAIAAWTGGLTYAGFRPASTAPAWRHLTATSASAGLAFLAYFSALVASGTGTVLSGNADTAPGIAGMLILAGIFGLGIGGPWGLMRRGIARSELPAPRGERVWPVARRTAGWMFLAFATLGLALFAPRAQGDGASREAPILAGAILVVPLAAVAAIAFRHRQPILRLAGLGAVVGIPGLTGLLALSGLSLGEAFAFSAASAAVWAPAFGLITWSVLGTQESGIRVSRTGVVTHVMPPGTPSASSLSPRRRHPRRRR